MKRLFIATLMVLFAAGFSASYGQKRVIKVPDKIKATPVYGALILRKVDVEAEMLALMEANTTQSPVVKAKQMEFALLKREIRSLTKIKHSLWPKLNDTYAKLVLRKVEVEAKMQALLLDHAEAHPDVKFTRIKLALLYREIKDFLS